MGWRSTGWWATSRTPDRISSLCRCSRWMSSKPYDPPHGWDSCHFQFNLGENNGFVVENEKWNPRPQPGHRLPRTRALAGDPRTGRQVHGLRALVLLRDGADLAEPLLHTRVQFGRRQDKLPQPVPEDPVASLRRRRPHEPQLLQRCPVGHRGLPPDPNGVGQAGRRI